ncbi:unnamed protein product [Gongylonema pulchrum]|uniref:Metallo-beta-lactamase domain-containing protein 1 n=1 Tax=Gongylonema pulchrum TaxID=637853 RepID=A0A183EMH8_9BILA|nr:unnamed protein product [Gongylonema pulchrum]
MESEPPFVFVLLDGYCTEAGCSPGWTNASGTVTLIKTRAKKVLVDCGNPWNGDDIVEALSKHSLGCDEITDLVITHGHSDHCGNLSLFKCATIYMGDDVATRHAHYSTFLQVLSGRCSSFAYLRDDNSSFADPSFAFLRYDNAPTVGELAFKIDENIEIWRTPGHTDHDLSVVVTGTDRGTIAISGDIFEEGFVDNWKVNSKYPEEQQKSRDRLVQVADWIVPGHGRMFKA